MRRIILALLILSAVAEAQHRPPINYIYANGTPLATPRSALNFQGTLTDDPVNKWTTIAIGGSVTLNTTSPLGGGGTGNTFTLTCTLCVLNTRTFSTTGGILGGGDLTADRSLSIDQTNFAPTWGAQHIFSTVPQALGMTAQSVNQMQFKTAYFDNSTGIPSFNIWAPGGGPNNFILALSQDASNFKIWSFTGSASGGPAINAYNGSGTFQGSLWFNTNGNGLTSSGSGVIKSLGTPTIPWDWVNAKVYHGAQQNISATGATSITVAGNGETIRITPTGNITSISIATGLVGDHITLIMVGAGGFTWPAAGSVSPTAWPAATFPSPTGTQTNICKMAWDNSVSKWVNEAGCTIDIR